MGRIAAIVKSRRFIFTACMLFLLALIWLTLGLWLGLGMMICLLATCGLLILFSVFLLVDQAKAAKMPRIWNGRSSSRARNTRPAFVLRKGRRSKACASSCLPRSRNSKRAGSDRAVQALRRSMPCHGT